MGGVVVVVGVNDVLTVGDDGTQGVAAAGWLVENVLTELFVTMMSSLEMVV